MNEMTEFDLDQDGKIDLNRIYDQPDPRGYYQTLSRLDYQIPSAAEPLFRKTLRALRRRRPVKALTVLDVGSSYGINAAILKHRYSLSGLFDIYGPEATEALPTPEALVERDRAIFSGERSDDSLVTVGLDTSAEAIGYAADAGIIDRGIVANFEERAPTETEAADIARVDLVVSTGAIGYVDAPTFDRILDAASRRPWFAMFALRMFPVERIARALKERGYSILKLHGETFRQRRFANRDEREEVLTRLDELGIDPAGCERDGWLAAEFFLARPREEAGAFLPNLVSV